MLPRARRPVSSSTTAIASTEPASARKSSSKATSTCCKARPSRAPCAAKSHCRTASRMPCAACASSMRCFAPKRVGDGKRCEDRDYRDCRDCRDYGVQTVIRHNQRHLNDSHSSHDSHDSHGLKHMPGPLEGVKVLDLTTV